MPLLFFVCLLTLEPRRGRLKKPLQLNQLLNNSLGVVANTSSTVILNQIEYMVIIGSHVRITQQNVNERTKKMSNAKIMANYHRSWNFQ
jgi:hypothetical protein